MFLMKTEKQFLQCIGVNVNIKTLDELQHYIDNLIKKYKITNYQIEGINILNLKDQIEKLNKSTGESIIFYPIIKHQREHEVGVAAVIFIDEQVYLKKEIIIED
jgi:hypothetical protein